MWGLPGCFEMKSDGQVAFINMSVDPLELPGVLGLDYQPLQCGRVHSLVADPNGQN